MLHVVGRGETRTTDTRWTVWQNSICLTPGQIFFLLLSATVQKTKSPKKAFSNIMTLKCDSADIEMWCVGLFIYCLTQLVTWQVSVLQCSWVASKLVTRSWLASWLRQHGPLHEALLRLLAILRSRTSPNAMPAVQTYLLSLWIWREYTPEKEIFHWGTCSESTPEISQSVVKNLSGD